MKQRQRIGQRLSWGEAKEILFCVMDALRPAHANNVVHVRRAMGRAQEKGNRLDTFLVPSRTAAILR
jgi:hypothetical protein